MSNFKPPNKVLKHAVSTWFTVGDYQFFKEIAATNKVTVSAYVRAVLVDAIAEERERLLRLNPNPKTDGNGAIVIAVDFGLR